MSSGVMSVAAAGAALGFAGGLAVPVVARWAERRPRPGGRVDPAAAVTRARVVLCAAVGAGVGAVVGSRFAPPAGLAAAAAGAAFFGWAMTGLVVGLTDLDQRRVPRPVIVAGTVWVGLCLVVAAGPDARWSRLAAAAATAAAGWALLWVVARLGGAGRGDAGVAGLLGLGLGWAGWPAAVTGMVAAVLLAAAWAVAQVALGKVGRGGVIPFAPFLVAGAVTGIAVTS